MENLMFGEKDEAANYQDRYAAYIIVETHGKIAMIEAPNGAFFLPGGEKEGQETNEEAISRELLEEMGISAEIACYLGEAAEYFYSNHRKTYFHNPGYFYVAKSWQKVGEPTEKDQSIWWVTPETALEKLKRGSHRWAVEKWLAMKEN